MSDRIEQIREPEPDTPMTPEQVVVYMLRESAYQEAVDLAYKLGIGGEDADVYSDALGELRDLIATSRTVDALRGEVEEGRQALRGVLKHCDVKSEAETAFERDVIAARAYLAKGGK